jgi:hypothetical protein
VHDVSLLRLYLLRATYLLIIVGVGSMIWPLLLDAPETVEHFRGVTWSLLGTVALLALLGLRYPLKMLPLLFFELIWKTTWEGAFAETWFANVMGLVIFPLVIPWGYVIRTYVRGAGDRWTRGSRTTPSADTPGDGEDASATSHRR